VRPFTGILINGYGNVVIRQDSVQSLTVEADDNIIDRVTTEVRGDLLFIDLKKASYTHLTLNIRATMKSIHRLECNGSGDFTTNGPIHTDEIDCKITGAGNISLAGTAGNQTVEITGSGNVRTFDLAATRCTATITGAGDIEVNVLQSLDATISGYGNITYMGNPEVRRQINGAGTIKPRS
jgi:hypothetical protein